MELFFISVLISYLALDITIAFQVLISSPIFACPLLGWILGDVWLGFELGILFQLLWLGKIPAGAFIVPEGNIATMLATVLVIMNAGIGFPNSLLTVVFIEAIGVSYLGSLLTIFYRKLNGKIFDLMLKEIEQIHYRILLLLEIGSMFLYSLLVFVLSVLVLKFSMLLLPAVVPRLGALFENQLIVVKPVILGIGLASVYHIVREALIRKTGNRIDRA